MGCDQIRAACHRSTWVTTPVSAGEASVPVHHKNRRVMIGNPESYFGLRWESCARNRTGAVWTAARLQITTRGGLASLGRAAQPFRSTARSLHGRPPERDVCTVAIVLLRGSAKNRFSRLAQVSPTESISTFLLVNGRHHLVYQ